MKKVIAISLVLVFLISTLGLSVVVNYCPMKQGYSFSMNEHKSCCCDDSDGDDCCKTTKYTLNKIEDKYVPSSFHFKPDLKIEFVAFAKDLSVVFPQGPYSNEAWFYKDLRPPKIPVSRTILYRSILV